MKNITSRKNSGRMLGLPPPGDIALTSERPRCSICTRRLRQHIAFLDETGDVPEPRQSWVFCAECDAAVRAELDRSPVTGPLRLRIAVGVVAAERSPHAVRRTRVGLRDDTLLMVMFWVFGIAMVIHVFVIAWVAFLYR
ncbi:MAG TPA: hypothetical protein VF818_00420 [Ktedonobacterales bacterium]